MAATSSALPTLPSHMTQRRRGLKQARSPLLVVSFGTSSSWQDCPTACDGLRQGHPGRDLPGGPSGLLPPICSTWLPWLSLILANPLSLTLLKGTSSPAKPAVGLGVFSPLHHPSVLSRLASPVSCCFYAS